MSFRHDPNRTIRPFGYGSHQIILTDMPCNPWESAGMFQTWKLNSIDHDRKSSSASLRPASVLNDFSMTA
jgi:hypothetical protein